MSTRALAAVAAVSSSGIFAGYTWALSHAAVPCIVLNTSSQSDLASAWRTQYLRGFYISRPLCAVNLFGFLYLAFTIPPSINNTTATAATTAKVLYFTAALLSASGVPYALTFLRRTNGALSIRAKKLAGGGEDPGAMALTYASGEARSLEREGAREWKETGELVRRWQWHNSVRTWVLVVGAVVGAVGVVVDGVGL